MKNSPNILKPDNSSPFQPCLIIKINQKPACWCLILKHDIFLCNSFLNVTPFYKTEWFYPQGQSVIAKSATELTSHGSFYFLDVTFIKGTIDHQKSTGSKGIQQHKGNLGGGHRRWSRFHVVYIIQHKVNVNQAKLRMFLKLYGYFCVFFSAKILLREAGQPIFW